MAHNSAHYSLVNVGLDLCNVMMGAMMGACETSLCLQEPSVLAARAQIELLSNQKPLVLAVIDFPLYKSATNLCYFSRPNLPNVILTHHTTQNTTPLDIVRSESHQRFRATKNYWAIKAENKLKCP